MVIIGKYTLGFELLSKITGTGKMEMLLKAETRQILL